MHPILPTRLQTLVVIRIIAEIGINSYYSQGQNDLIQNKGDHIYDFSEIYNIQFGTIGSESFTATIPTLGLTVSLNMVCSTGNICSHTVVGYDYDGNSKQLYSASLANNKVGTLTVDGSLYKYVVDTMSYRSGRCYYTYSK